MKLKKISNQIGIGLLAVSSLHAFSATGKEVPPQKQPNIILFLVDDMGWQDTSVPLLEEGNLTSITFR